MDNATSVTNYSLEEQEAMLKKVQALNKENERKRIVYTTQLEGCRQELEDLMKNELFGTLGIDIDLEMLDDKDYVNKLKDLVDNTIENQSRRYRLSMDDILKRLESIEKQ